MESNLYDDSQSQSITSNERILTKHGDPVRPVSSEEEVAIAAKNVVPVVPLPERKKLMEESVQEVRTAEIKQSAITSLSAEDIHEADL